MTELAERDPDVVCADDEPELSPERAALYAQFGIDPYGAFELNLSALDPDARLSPLAAKIVAVLACAKLEATSGPDCDQHEQAAAVAELEHVAPILEPHVARWERERRVARRLRLANIVHRLLARPQARARGRRARRATLRRSPARSPGSREPDPPARPLEAGA